MDGDVVRRKHSQVHPTVRIIHSLIHSFIHSDCDEGSRTVLTNRGITYMTESRRRITGIMTIQAYIECKQAKLLLQTCIQSKAEILLLQKSIRSLMIRRLTKEDVAKCDKDTTIEPRAGKIFSSRNKDAQLVNESLFITQSVVNHCLEEEFAVHPKITSFFKSKHEKKLVKSLQDCSVEEIAEKIDREKLYGYYHCENGSAFAIV